MFNVIILGLTLICSRPVAIVEGINCPPNWREVKQIVTAWYDPAQGGINCNGDCDVLADNQTWNELDRGHVGACLPDWYYRTIVIPGANLRLLCRDTGGDIVVTWDERCKCWVIPLDVLWDSNEPFPFNKWIWSEWWLE